MSKPDLLDTISDFIYDLKIFGNLIAFEYDIGDEFIYIYDVPDYNDDQTNITIMEMYIIAFNNKGAKYKLVYDTGKVLYNISFN